jgi:hypothetical protein
MEAPLAHPRLTVKRTLLTTGAAVAALVVPLGSAAFAQGLEASGLDIEKLRLLDEEGDDRCRVGDEEATLVLWAPDYDGGHKAWVRWPDGNDDIVPGSQVVRGE